MQTTISHYSILTKLGAGGMGEVYLAEDTRLDRRVALKLLPTDSVADENAKRRLVREAKAAAQLDHPNICSIYEVGEEDGRSFIVMQYVDGETLASRIQRSPLELTEALDIAAQTADALVYVGLGDKDQAFAWLEKAYEARSWYLTWLKVAPELDSLRSDQRFADLMRRVSFTP